MNNEKLDKLFETEYHNAYSDKEIRQKIKNRMNEIDSNLVEEMEIFFDIEEGYSIIICPYSVEIELYVQAYYDDCVEIMIEDGFHLLNETNLYKAISFELSEIVHGLLGCS